MPYSGGTYTLSDTIANGTPEDATELQAILDDIATALNLPFLRDGTAVATGQFLGIVGATAQYSFSGDTDTGFGSDTGDVAYIKAGGVKTVTVSATGQAVTGTQSVSGFSTGPGHVPVGAVMDFAGASAPSGWLLCFGQSLVRADYAALFTAIGTTHGAADGTHFNVPDCRGRVGAGKDDMGGSAASQLTTGLTGGVDGATLGAKGGEQGHVITSAELAAHTHTGTTASNGLHGHPARYDAQANGNSDGTGGIMLNSDTNSNVGSFTGTPDATAGHQIGGDGAHTHTFTSASTGSDASHNTVQPTIIFNKIIFAGV